MYPNKIIINFNQHKSQKYLQRKKFIVEFQKKMPFKILLRINHQESQILLTKIINCKQQIKIHNLKIIKKVMNNSIKIR